MNKKKLFISFFILISCCYNLQRSTRINWDVFGYYLYLPAQFIYHDILLEKKEEWLLPVINKYNTTDNLYQAYKGPHDKYVMKYTMGLSFVYAPFFFIADGIAATMHYERDGFSPPYQLMLLLCSLFASALGISYLFKVLELYFSPAHALITVILITLGTNYFVMTAYDGLMPHNFIFTLFVIMLWHTIKWYKEFKLKQIIIIGFCIGLATLIRPTSILVILIPIFWDLKTMEDLQNRFLIFLTKWKQMLILFLTALLVMLPQLIYWKSTTGHWIFYSYPGERINLFKPHLMEVLFSYKKGWLLYTPLMIVSLAGFLFLFKNYRSLFLSIFLFFCINTYVISCWDCWWYGGSFAERPFVESYTFMAFPFAAIIAELATKKMLLKIIFYIVCILLTILNLFQTWQATNGIIHTTLTTKEYYWRVFLKTYATPEDRRWLEPEQYIQKNEELPVNENLQHEYADSLRLSSNNSILNSNNPFSQAIILPQNLPYNLCDHYLLVKVRVDTAIANLFADDAAHLVVIINKKDKLYEYRSNNLTANRLISNNGVANLTVVIPPQCIGKEYEIKTYLYIDGKSRLRLISFRAELFQKIP